MSLGSDFLIHDMRLYMSTTHVDQIIKMCKYSKTANHYTIYF